MSSLVAVVVGTRPEAIKLAPVVRALVSRGISPLLIFSGQHPKLDPADHGLGPFAALRLTCAGQDDPHAHVGAVSKAILEALGATRPDLFVVQGDTSTALGVPLLVLRDKTERPEAIACGNVELVGTDHDRIVAAVRRRLNSGSSAGPSLPFGDGRASERIAAIIEEWLGERAARSEALPPISSGWSHQLGNW